MTTITVTVRVAQLPPYLPPGSDLSDLAQFLRATARAIADGPDDIVRVRLLVGQPDSLAPKPMVETQVVGPSTGPDAGLVAHFAEVAVENWIARHAVRAARTAASGVAP